jgi:hypothetical protein
MYLTKPCPNCDTPTVRSETADASEAVSLDGKSYKRGDRVHVCDSCGVIAGVPGSSSKKKSPAKRSGSSGRGRTRPAAKSSAKPKRSRNTTGGGRVPARGATGVSSAASPAAGAREAEGAATGSPSTPRP